MAYKRAIFIFVCMKDYKESIIVWIVINVFEIFSINFKVYMVKAWYNQKCFCMFKTLKFQMDSPYFFLPNVHHSFWKLERILTLMIRRAKWWTNENCFFNLFEHIWFKCVFDPKNSGFWKCDLNKSYSYLCNRGHECIIYMIYNQFVVKTHL